MAARDVCVSPLQDDSAPVRQLLPAVALALPRVHGIVIHNPPAWVSLPAELAFDQLRYVDLQVRRVTAFFQNNLLRNKEKEYPKNHPVQPE